MKDIQKYNVRVYGRVNGILRKFVNKANRKRLVNQDFTLLCNNCNGGIISHDLHLRFRSPTVNLFFYSDHFLKFCENFDYYISQPLTLCKEPLHQPEIEYPVCNLGDLELHFLHYHSFEEAKEKWESRSQRINRDNIFVMWTFFGGTDEQMLNRFEKLPFKNKVAFTEKDFPDCESAFYIRGFEEEGLGVLSWYSGLRGKRVLDQFDYVTWFNGGKK